MMGRPPKHNWDKIVAEYLAGASRQDLCESYNISRGRISEEFKKRGIDTQDSELVDASQAITSVFANVSKLTEQGRSETQIQAVFDVGAAKGISAMKSERNKHALYDAIMSMIPSVEKASEVKDLALANKALDDAGKVDTAIQINNNQAEAETNSIKVSFVTPGENTCSED